MYHTFNVLEALLRGPGPDTGFHLPVVHWDFLDLGEEIRDDAVEQFQIILEELGNVGITDGTENNQLLQDQEYMRSFGRPWHVMSCQDQEHRRSFGRPWHVMSCQDREYMRSFGRPS